MNLYIVYRAVYNNINPDENDGKLYEISITSLEPTDNQPLLVNAGPDETVTLLGSAVVDGTVNDDGLPDPPGRCTTTWSVLSGSGPVTFTDSSCQSS